MVKTHLNLIQTTLGHVNGKVQENFQMHKQKELVYSVKLVFWSEELFLYKRFIFSSF